MHEPLLVANIVLNSLTLAGVLALAFRAGKLVQKVDDIDRKGCSRMQDGCGGR